MKKSLILLGAGFLFISRLYAQWECSSQLGAWLKPAGNSNLFWGAELTGSGGSIAGNLIFNSLGFLGLDWSTDKSTLYAEGGYKYWRLVRNDLDLPTTFDNAHWGIREMFYQYHSGSGKLTLGIQSARFDDDYLLNERMVGLSYKLNKGAWALNFAGGSVTKDFARNGNFCSVGYLYDIIPDRERSLIGEVPGETNLVGATLRFSPSKWETTKQQSAHPDDEFSSDEFSQSLTGANSNEPKALSISSIGLASYNEFGDWIDNPIWLGGMFAEFNLFSGIDFRPEVLYQSAKGSHALIYSLILERNWELSKSRTNISFRYIGLSAIDEGAKALNSFSNIFAGDVLRLDAMDLPMFQAGIKYTLPAIKTHLKLQYSAQTSGSPMKEFDLSAGKKFGKRMQVNAVGGLVNAASLGDTRKLGRVEFRFYF